MSTSIVLAHESSFALGPVQVTPSTLTLERDDIRRVLEPKVMQVLVALARAHGEVVSRQDLADACWDGRIVGEASINRVLSRLRRLEQDLGADAFRIETIPRVGYRLSTPGHAEAVAPPRAAAPPRPRRLVLGGVAAVALALVLAAGAYFLGGFGRSSAETQWLDLAGVTASAPDPGAQRLGDELHDALLTALAANGVEPTPGARGEAAAARLRLTATVNHDGERYVIRTKLVEARTGAMLWSKRFERPVADSTGFEEVTAAHVSGVSLCARWHARRYRGRMPDEVLALVLRACSATYAHDGEEELEATARLVRAAPRLSDAHSMRALAFLGATSRVWGTEAMRASQDQAKAEAEAALARDPDNAEAHAVLGMDISQPLLARERSLLRALAADPAYPRATGFYIWFLQETGRLREAAQSAARGAAQDPFNTSILERLGWLQAVAGEADAAQNTLRKLELVAPAQADNLRRRIAFWWPDSAEAAGAIRTTAGGADPDVEPCWRDYLAAPKQSGLPKSCDGVQPDIVTRLLARSGQVDAAFAAAEVTVREMNSRTVVLFYPEMAAVRRDPRFMPFADRLGLVSYWLESNHWPDFCAEPGLPYDCRAVARRLHPR